MKIAWLGLGLCLLAQPGSSKDNPTAECSWLYDRIAALEQAIKQGDELGSWHAGGPSSKRKPASNTTTESFAKNNGLTIRSARRLWHGSECDSAPCPLR